MNKNYFKTLSVIVALSCIISIFSFSTFADDRFSPYPDNASVVYYDDGSYDVTVITVNPITVSGDSIAAVTSVTSGSKTTTRYSSSNEALYSLTIYGNFSYNGSSATATSATYDYTIYASSWSLVSGSASVSGATATASGTFRQYLIFTQTLSVSLSCTASGSLY